nr:hypothetical protein [Tanacetum cinerariifolium]
MREPKKIVEMEEDAEDQSMEIPTIEQLLDEVNKQKKLFKTTSSRFSPTPPREPTPPRDSSKGKAVAIIEEPRNELVKYQEEEGFDSKMPKLKSFITPEGPLSQEEYNNQIREIKRLNDLKAEQERTDNELRKLFNPATLKAHAQKMTKLEAKKATMMRGYKHQISFRADTLPITKINYVINKAKRLGLPLPPELATFGLTAKEKKKKMTELIREVFVTKNVRVDGIDKNLIPPPGIMPI